MEYTDIPETALLRALWAFTRPVGRGVHAEAARGGAEPTADEIRHLLGTRAVVTVDYLYGRPLKVTLDRRQRRLHGAPLYDREAGPGTAARVLAALQHSFGNRAVA